MNKLILVVLAVVAFAGSDAARSQDAVRASILGLWEARAKTSRVISAEFQLETILYPTKNSRAITDLLQKEERFSNTYSVLIDFAKACSRWNLTCRTAFWAG